MEVRKTSLQLRGKAVCKLMGLVGTVVGLQEQNINYQVPPSETDMVAKTGLTK